jgi:phenylacetate-coenzyme A ligase PaaK-like adenylate-forming protein
LAIQQKLAGRMRPEKILALQERRLRRLVGWAKERSPFHARRLASVDPARFKLAEIPPLTKAEMMEHFDEFLTDRELKREELEDFIGDPERLGRYYRDRFVITRTSGTQGVPALIVQDRSVLDLLFALQMTRGTTFSSNPLGIISRYLRPARLAAVTIGKGFYPSAVGLAYAPPAARRLVDRFWLTHIEPLDDVVAALNRYQPDVLLGYANVLEILAREALAARLRLGQRTPLRQVINMSEPLSTGARRLITQAFGLPVTNNYASGECMFLSLGCPEGHGMHLQADWAVLEVVDREYRPVPPGHRGDRVLITNLANTLQPFIRYELPDAVTVSPEPCPCGSPLPLIKEVAGRSDELVWVRDGERYRQIHPYVFIDVLDAHPPLGWYQVIQHERNRFLLRAAPAPRRHLNRDELRRLLEHGLRRFGLADVIEFNIEITDRLAPDPKSGKLKRITSRLGRPRSVEEDSRAIAPAVA